MIQSGSLHTYGYSSAIKIHFDFFLIEFFLCFHFSYFAIILRRIYTTGRWKKCYVNGDLTNKLPLIRSNKCYFRNNIKCFKKEKVYKHTLIILHVYLNINIHIGDYRKYSCNQTLHSNKNIYVIKNFYFERFFYPIKIKVCYLLLFPQLIILKIIYILHHLKTTY